MYLFNILLLYSSKEKNLAKMQALFTYLMFKWIMQTNKNKESIVFM